jgi:hypothetical protein
MAGASGSLRRVADPCQRSRTRVPPECDAGLGPWLPDERRPSAPSRRQTGGKPPVAGRSASTLSEDAHATRASESRSTIPSAQRPVQNSNFPIPSEDANGVPLLTACSWCGRYRLDGVWLKRKKTRERLGLPGSDPDDPRDLLPLPRPGGGSPRPL